MKLVKKNIKEPEFNKHYLIPSIIAAGLIPLIVHEHTGRTYLEDEEWFAVGNYSYTDLYLFWKQWALIILAGICIIILLMRAKYYYEDLPWEKRAFIPAVIYGVFVILSACFAINHVFSFGGGYDMYQSAITLLSYLIIAYYTYTCIKSEEHILYLLRGVFCFVSIELLLCVLQMAGHDLILTKLGQILVLNPSNWSFENQFTSSNMICGSLYNPDYLSMYFPVLIPVAAALIFTEKKLWRKICSLVVVIVSIVIMKNAALTGILALAAAIFIGFMIYCSRTKKLFVSVVIVVAILLITGIAAVVKIPSLNSRFWMEWDGGDTTRDADQPVQQITTGTKDEGVTFVFHDRTKMNIHFNITDNEISELEAYDGDGNQLTITDSDGNGTYMVSDEAYVDKQIYLYKDTSMGPTCLAVTVSGGLYHFSDMPDTGSTDDSELYMISMAGRSVKLPQKNPPESVAVFANGFWNGRGPIYNHSIPLLKKYIVVGAGADNFIMAYPQRDYVHDPYTWGATNALNVKPHSYYLQVWIQEGFIAFEAMMVFLFWYLIKSIRLYYRIDKHDHMQILGFSVMIGVVAYLIAVIANDSTICTAPVFWTVLGLGWGINALVEKKQREQIEKD